MTDDDDDSYVVYCYDISQDKWTTLPPLPVRYFGLGQVNGKLVAVGGFKRNSIRANEVYTYYDERSRKWKQTIPPMPVARCSPGVLSLQSALVVAGGNKGIWGYTQCTSVVEIFKPDTSQWYRTDHIPIACQNISLVAIGNKCYTLGGYNGLYLNQALYVSVDDLLCNAVPANQTTHSGSSDTQSAWKTLSNTPMYQLAAAVLAGNLLAIGGKETSDSWRSVDKKKVFMYSPSTNSWVYISDLPASRSFTTVAVLSSTEVLVIGGWSEGERVNTVYRGTLTCTMSV